MHWTKWLRSRSRRKTCKPRALRVLPQVEPLESRRMLAVDPAGYEAPEDPGVELIPLAALDQNIQEDWSAQSTGDLSVSEHTGEKPQSKVWTQGGDWFAVMPNSDGTFIWRLDDGAWTQLLRLSESDAVHADVKAIGNLAHVLLFDGGDTQLASVEYNAATRSYDFWSVRPGNVNLPLPGSTETATIDIDSTGRMWVAYENKSDNAVEVRYSDGDYSSWSGAITVAEGISNDDISTVVAMGNGQIGVFWSDQSSDRFGFRTHDDGADPNQWNAFEVPAAQSAINSGNGMADDHVNVTSASDGTIYAAVKTGYDSSGTPEIALLVRRPNGSWDPLHAVSTRGTRPVVVLNEALGRVLVAYTERDGGGDILYRETSTDSISFGAAEVLISGGSLNNVTTTKQQFTNEVLFLAATGSNARGTLLVAPDGGSTPPPAPNAAPVVNAGADRSGQTASSVTLSGWVSDDGQPSGVLLSQWTVLSGPGDVSFGDATSPQTTATFSAAGTYVLRLTASDGAASSSDDVTVTITSPAPTPDGGTPALVGFWNFGGGTDYPSLLGDQGSLQGGATINADGTLQLNGSGQRYEVASADALQFADAITISAWIKPNERGTQYIIKKAESNAIDGFELSLSNRGTIFVRFNEDSSGNAYRLNSDTDYPTGGNTWMHVAATYDGSTIRLYINGEEEASLSANFQIGTNDLPLTIGSGEGGYRSMNGQLDEVLVTDRALSADEIRQVYEGTFAPTPTPEPGNQAPSVSAGADVSTTLGTSIVISGAVSDDGLPTGELTTQWTRPSGPGLASFGNPNATTTTVTFDTAGTYVLRLTASDGSYSVSDEIVVTVSAPPQENQAPSVNAGADQSTTVGVAIEISGVVGDDGLPSGKLGTRWTRPSGPGIAAFNDPYATTTMVTFDTAGTYVLRLTASDGLLSTSDEIVVTVTAPSPEDQTISVNAGADQATTVGASIVISGVVSDDGLPSGDLTTRWRRPSGPGVAAFDNPYATTTNVTFDTAGTYVLRLTASDGSHAASDEIVVTVAAAPENDPPTVNAGADQSTTVGASIVISGVVSDDGLPAGNLTTRWRRPSGPGVAAFDDPFATTTNVTFDTAGTYVLRLFASDGSYTVSDDIVITVAPAPNNDPPTVNAGADQSTTVGASIVISGVVSDDGLPAGNLTTRWRRPSGPGVAAFDDPFSTTTNVTFDTAGTYVLRLYASDGSYTVSDDIVITVAPAPNNNPPNVNAGSDRSTTVGASIVISGLVSDDGLPVGNLTTRWTRPSGPGVAAFDDPYATTTNVTFDTAGTYVLRLTAFDGSHSASDEIVVTVAPPAPANEAPSVSAGANLTAETDEAVLLQGLATDDGQPSGVLLSQWTVLSGPGDVSFGDATSPQTTATFSAAGTYVLRLTASDGAYTVSDEIVVTVTALPQENQAPSVNAGADQATRVGTPVELSGSASDDGAPAGNLTTQWTKVSGPGEVAFSNPSGTTTSATFSTAGTYVLRLTASDGSLSAADVVTVVVEPAAAPSSDVVARWNFDSPDDVSGNGNDGSFEGGATLGAGQSGGGLQLGGNGQRMVVPDSDSLDLTESITVAAWIKPTGRDTQYIVKKADHNAVDGFELSLSRSGTVFVRFNQDSAGNEYRVDSDTRYPTDGDTWMHVAATYDGSTIRLYINGQEQASIDAEFTIAANDIPLSIGAGADGYRSMQGGIDDVLLANRALTSNEIQALYEGNF